MPTRISGACNGCRAKKQKCSGDRNGCAQCEVAGIVCTWPEQRKRGPAKGYIEGLENRLHDAESLLLQILPLVSTDQLRVATSMLSSQEYDDSERLSPDRRGSPPVLNKKTGIEYWENFPLTSVNSIRRWQKDCEAHHSSSSQLSVSHSVSRQSSPGHLQSPPEDVRRQRHSVSAMTPRHTFSRHHSADVYRMSEDPQVPSQMIPAQGSQVIYNHPQHGPWQTPMMGMDTGQGAMAPQVYSQTGYYAGPWPQQQQPGMPVSTTASMHNPPLPTDPNDPNAHLFW